MAGRGWLKAGSGRRRRKGAKLAAVLRSCGPAVLRSCGRRADHGADVAITIANPGFRSGNAEFPDALRCFYVDGLRGGKLRRDRFCSLRRNNLRSVAQQLFQRATPGFFHALLGGRSLSAPGCSGCAV